MRAMIIGLCAALLLTGCADGSADSAGPSAAAASIPQLIDEAHANFTISVTNQSRIDGNVDLEVSIDGIRLVKQRFPVGSQHTLISFPARVAPGPHVLKVVSETGIIQERAFDPSNFRHRYAAVAYINNDDYDAQHVAHRIKQIDIELSEHRVLMS